MIHSLAGGRLRTNSVFDFAKLEFESLPNQYFWYISEIDDLKPDDTVLAPFGVVDEPQKAKVIRVDKNISSTSAPVSIKRIKRIIKKI